MKLKSKHSLLVAIIRIKVDKHRRRVKFKYVDYVENTGPCLMCFNFEISSTLPIELSNYPVACSSLKCILI